MSSQYVIPPPDVPEFMYKSYSSTWIDLIQWANREYRARLHYLAKNGYVREFKVMNEEYSPIRILAELSGYRRFCSKMTQGVWDKFSGRERVFIRRAYELRDILKR